MTSLTDHEHRWNFDYLSVLKLWHQANDGEIPREMEIRMGCSCGADLVLSGKLNYRTKEERDVVNVSISGP